MTYSKNNQTKKFFDLFLESAFFVKKIEFSIFLYCNMASLVIIQNSGPAGQLKAVRDTLEKQCEVVPEAISAAVAAISGREGDEEFVKKTVCEASGALCGEAVQQIFAKVESDSVAEALFSVIISLLKFAAEDKLEHFAENVAEVAERSKLRLLVLSNVFNAVECNNKVRFDLLTRTLQFAADANITNLIMPEIARLSDYLDAFEADDAQRRQLYELGCKIIRNSDSVDDHLFLNILPKYLATFESAHETLSQEAIDAAEKAVLLAVGIPNVFRMDHLLNIRAVKGLAEIPEKKPVFYLLHVFCTGCLPEYKAFLAANGNFLQEKALDGNLLEKKMKILSLVTICSNASGEIPLSKLAEGLEVEEDDVDAWFVEALSHGLISGKIDATQKVARPVYCEPRVFGKEQWAMLAERLRSWERSTAHMMQYLKEAEERAARDKERAARIPNRKSKPSE